MSQPVIYYFTVSELLLEVKQRVAHLCSHPANRKQVHRFQKWQLCRRRNVIVAILKVIILKPLLTKEVWFRNPLLATLIICLKGFLSDCVCVCVCVCMCVCVCVCSVLASRGKCKAHKTLRVEDLTFSSCRGTKLTSNH